MSEHKKPDKPAFFANAARNAGQATRAHHQRQPQEIAWDTVIDNLKAMLDRIDRQ